MKNKKDINKEIKNKKDTNKNIMKTIVTTIIYLLENYSY